MAEKIATAPLDKKASTLSSKKSIASNSVKSSFGAKKPLEEHKFKTASFKKLPKLYGEDVCEIDMEDVLYYKQNEGEYKVQKGEKLIPYIVRMNERFKTKATSMKRTRRVKKGMKVTFYAILMICLVILVYYIVQKTSFFSRGT